MFENLFKKPAPEPERPPVDPDILEMQKKTQELAAKVLGEDKNIKESAINPEVGKFSFNENEIRAEGKKKGWSDAQIEAKVLEMKSKIETANARISEDKGNAAVSSLESDFQKRYESDPEFRKRVDDLAA